MSTPDGAALQRLRRGTRRGDTATPSTTTDVPAFTLVSNDVADGRTLPSVCVHPRAGGGNLSPHLRWSGAPSRTRSFVVSCLDPDAPGGQGFWHWVLIDVPATCVELPRGAGGADGVGLPAGALHLRNGFRTAGYGGAAPPPGDPPHRYVFAVEALDTDRLGVGPDTGPDSVRTLVSRHVLARAELRPVYGR